MALVTIDLHGQILNPATLAPAVGTVRFRILQELRDLVGNVTYSPATFTATLDINGEFTITGMPVTDNTDVTPVGWAYEVWINTDVLTELYYVYLPESAGPTAEFTDLTVVDYDPCTGTANIVTASGTTLPYLPLTGGTVTGDVTVLGDTTVKHGSSFVVDAGEALSTVVSTGLISGGIVGIDTNPANATISAFTGYVVDHTTDQLNPTISRLDVAGQIIPMDAGALSRPVTFWLADSTGSIIQQASRPDAAQRRTHFELGSTVQVGGVIVLAQTVPSWTNYQPGPQIADLMDALGTFPIDGNVLSANGVNLFIDKTAGTLFARGSGYESGGSVQAAVNQIITAAQSPVQYRRATAVSIDPTLYTAIDVANYDPNGSGVITPVGLGVGAATTFRVWALPNKTTTDQIAIQYGQIAYASLANAVAAIGTGSYIKNPAYVNAALIGWISAIRTATDLSNPAEATFTPATSKFTSP